MDRILIIDDSVVQANMLTAILEEDYAITQAHTAEDGLNWARGGDFSLILLDVVMPEMDGFGLLRKLQEEVVTQHTPVILITSLRDVEHEEWGLTLGAVDYITKPYHPHIVRARVNTHIKLYHYWQQIEQQAMVDPLTGVSNRRSYDASYYSKWQDAIRLKVPISLCMMDIDKFKIYNDSFGHPAGDKVICAVAKTVDSSLRRSTDFFARYGGEEFVAIMLGGESNVMFDHIIGIRRAVENMHIPHSPEAGPWVTVSIGGVTLIPKAGDDYATYLKIADVMLYDAKRLGRNQVVWTNEKMEQMREH
ncbi:MAG: diguanylate cyclase [Lawsonibacter sp.]|nr:diguanylate cyclase [Lawsonibacter sp.]